VRRSGRGAKERKIKLKKKKLRTWFRYQKRSTGLPPTLTSLRDPLGRSSGLRTGTQLEDEEEEASEAEEAAATVVVVVAGKEVFVLVLER